MMLIIFLNESPVNRLVAPRFGAPQNLTATVASATSVTLTWNSPSPIAATKYTVVRTLGGGTTETLKDLIGRRVLAGLDPTDGILGLGAF